jgi:hypothetical protein
MEIIGLCPICDREMWKGQFVDKHHFLPKCRGGKETEWVHKVCHRKIHSVFTEKELEKKYNNSELLKEHPEMEKFIKLLFIQAVEKTSAATEGIGFLRKNLIFMIVQ